MVNTREFRGTNQQIARQIEQVKGRIISAYVVVDEPTGANVLPSDEEFARLMKELDALAVDAPNADYSREAMYTRMPGE